jgi:hypothetical protein
MKMATYPDPDTRFWEYASENWPLSPVLTVLGLLVLGLALNWRKRSRPWLLAMSLILTGLCLALRLGVGVDAAAQLERAEVLRSGPGDAFLQLGKLEAGARVRVPDTAAREAASGLPRALRQRDPPVGEPVLGPLWVWLIHQETPRAATLWGGGVVFVALLAHVLWQLREAPATET